MREPRCASLEALILLGERRSRLRSPAKGDVQIVDGNETIHLGMLAR